MNRRQSVIMSRPEALELLAPILTELTAIPQEAFSRYNETIRTVLPLNTARGQASDLHELCAQCARERLGGRPHIELLEERIAPGVAPGLFHNPTGIPPGESLNAIFGPGNGSTAGPLWFGAASG